VKKGLSKKTLSIGGRAQGDMPLTSNEGGSTAASQRQGNSLENLKKGKEKQARAVHKKRGIAVNERKKKRYL